MSALNDTSQTRPGKGQGPFIDQPCPADVMLEWVNGLFAADQHVEVRAFGAKVKVYTRRFAPSERGVMVGEAIRLNGLGREVYYTLNPILPETSGVASDGAIERRRLLLIDCDPGRDPDAVKAHGVDGKVSASDAEKGEAYLLMSSIGEALQSRGWPRPIEADSGNGYHLIYPVDLPNDNDSRDLLKAVLRTLSYLFGSVEADVDTVVYNASRITKFYGTVAHKGEATRDRPHRASKIMVIPKDFGSKLVTTADLVNLVADEPKPEAKPSPVILPGPTMTPRPTDGRWTPEARAVAYLQKCDPAVEGKKGHNQALKTACKVGPGFDLPPETALALLRDVWNPTCEPPWSEAELLHKITEAYKIEKRRGWLKDAPRDKPGVGAKCREDQGPLDGGTDRGHPDQDRPNEAHDDPHRLARIYRDSRCSHADRPTLVYHQAEFLRWDGAYRPVHEKEVRAELNATIKAEFDRINTKARKAHASKAAEKIGGGYDTGKEKPEPKASKVTSQLVGNVVQALGSYVLVPGKTELPAWLTIQPPFPAVEILPTRNALVHLPSFVEGKKATVSPTPLFFCPFATGYDFEPKAPEPENWLAFLRELWPDDPESPTILAEWFGYHLLPDMSQQKIGMLIGPKRSGKGTIARVLTAMVGQENVCNPTLSALGTQFGMAPLIGKMAAIITDARLSGRSDIAQIVENLLSVSGEDGKTIDRKHLPAWTGRLKTRFTLLSNETPRLADASGALAGRMIIFRMTRSFYGVEDTGLFERIAPELPGILLWAIRGWKRLRQRGNFIQPEGGRSLVREMEELSSPVGMFVKERCDVGPGLEVETGKMFEAWKSWCEGMSRDHIGDQQSFGRNLRSVIPNLETGDRRRGGERFRAFVGIDLKAPNF